MEPLQRPRDRTAVDEIEGGLGLGFGLGQRRAAVEQRNGANEADEQDGADERDEARDGENGCRKADLARRQNFPLRQPTRLAETRISGSTHSTKPGVKSKLCGISTP